jgi:SAM-dependent methyltransferase
MNSTTYYNTNASRYITDTINADMTALRDRFLVHIPAGGTILDAGCGSGRDAKAFMEAGYEVYAMDASQAMVEHCRNIIGDRVTLATFQDYETEMKFDGIWACASLLHLKPEELDAVLKKFAGFIKPGGIFFMSFKYGTGNYVKDGRYFNCQTGESITEIVTSLRPDHAAPVRTCLDLSCEVQAAPSSTGPDLQSPCLDLSCEVQAAPSSTGPDLQSACQDQPAVTQVLSIAEIFITEDVRPGRPGEKWVNVIARNM